MILAVAAVLLSAPPSLAAGGARLASLSPQIQPNILMIVLDDCGFDKLSIYGTTSGFKYPATPNLEALRQQGILYTRAYADPVCSPSRSCIMTGQYGFRTGVLSVIGNSTQQTCGPGGTTTADQAFTLPPSQPTGFPYPYECLPQQLRALGYNTGAFGKWHLSVDSPSHYCHPIACGFDVFVGHMANNEGSTMGENGHFGWERVSSLAGPGGACSVGPHSPALIKRWDARVIRSTASNWIAAQPGPFFAYVAFNPPHESFQVPPLDGSWVCATLNSPGVRPTNGYSQATWDDLCQAGLTTPGTSVAGVLACDQSSHPLDYDNARILERAMIEEMDWEIGQLILSIPSAVYANTMVVVINDNGTPGTAIDQTSTPNTSASGGPPYPPNHGKRTHYDLGTRVPLIIKYPNAPSGIIESGLVGAVDLWNTVVEAAGGTANPNLDSISFLQSIVTGSAMPRDKVYCELSSKNGWIWDSTASPRQWVNLDAGPIGIECAPDLSRSAVMKDTFAGGTGHYYKLIQSAQIGLPVAPPCPASYLLPYSCHAYPSSFCPIPAQPLEELYDLGRDPNEVCNLIDSSGLCAIRDMLRSYMQSLSGP